jgi:hypothetical protein
LNREDMDNFDSRHAESQTQKILTADYADYFLMESA